jgi:hypothetical protein
MILETVVAVVAYVFLAGWTTGFLGREFYEAEPEPEAVLAGLVWPITLPWFVGRVFGESFLADESALPLEQCSTGEAIRRLGAAPRPSLEDEDPTLDLELERLFEPLEDRIEAACADAQRIGFARPLR